MNKVLENNFDLQIGSNESTYKQAIDILTSQGKFHIKLGLERVLQMLELMGNPQKSLQFIHVAGTNGKGSVCAMLSAIIGINGLRVGLFTSPHVFEYTERIKINDVEIEKEIFAQLVNDIVKLADKSEVHLTEFEILAVVAFKYFVGNNVDIVLLETGLGGRLDATNVIDNNICSIITHIDLDHTERLGDTIDKIAYEKAGIIKENCPVIVSHSNLGFGTINTVAKEKKSEIIIVQEGQNLLLEKFALKGTYQAENLALVLSAINILRQNGFNISPKVIDEGLKRVNHPCRFQYLEKENILIDGAHNPNGTKALRESLDYYFPNQKIKYIFGCLKNKKYSQMLKNLFSPSKGSGEEKYNTQIFTPEIYFYHFDNPNSCTCEELASVCEMDSKPFNEFKKEDNTLTVICGSFYMIKELLSKMGIK